MNMLCIYWTLILLPLGREILEEMDEATLKNLCKLNNFTSRIKFSNIYFTNTASESNTCLLANTKNMNCFSHHYIVLFYLLVYKIFSFLCNAINSAIFACKWFLHLRGLFVKTWETFSYEAFDWKF